MGPGNPEDPKGRTTLVDTSDETEETASNTRGALWSVVQRAQDMAATNPRGADELTERYEMGDELGRGGAGEVHQAHDRRLRRDVAMKTLKSGTLSEEMLARFIQEAQITSQLEHPNIPPVHDVGTGPKGTVFFTMKRVTGRTLSKVVGGPESLVRRLDLFLKVCDAVAYAHSRGVMHRDLKPSNVMVGEYGEVYVLDWGLAKLVGAPELPVTEHIHTDPSESQSLLTIDGRVMGTPSYMSPEQARGEHTTVDFRTDVYGLGVLLYSLLCGDRAFKGNAVEVLEAVVSNRFLSPAIRKPGVPWELDAVVLRAMSLRPEDRYQSVEDLREDIQRYLEGQPVSAARYTPQRRAMKWAGRHRRMVAAVAVTASIGATILVASLVLYAFSLHLTLDRVRQAEHQASIRLADGEVGLARAHVEMGLVSEAQHMLGIATARYVEYAHTPQKATLLASAIHLRFPPPDLSWVADHDVRTVAISEAGDQVVIVGADNVVRLYALPLGEQVVTWDVAPETVGQASVGGGRPQVVLISPGRYRVADVLTKQTRIEVALPDPLPYATHSILSGDGSVLVLTSPTLTETWRTDDGTRAGPAMPGFRGLEISHDGTRIAGTEPVAGSPHRSVDALTVIEVATGERLMTGPYGHVDLSADGALMLVQSGDEVILFDVDSEAERWRVEAPPHSRVALTLDGERAILAGADHTVEVRDVQSGAILYQRSMLSGLGNSHGSIAVSEHGNTLFSWVAGTVHLWTLRDGDSDGLRVAENLTALDVSSDGLLLATAGRDGVVRLWDWRSHSLLREIPLTTEGSRDVVFSADGSRLLAANRDGTAHLLDTISGERLATWTMPDHGIAMAGAIYGENTAVVGWETGLIAGFDTDTGAERWRVEADLKTLWGLEISADERWLAASGRGKDPLVELWDLSPSSPVREWRSTVELAGFRVAFSADGRRIAAGSRNGLTHVFDVSDPGPIHVLKGRSESIQSAAFSADGSLLAVGAYDGRLHLYDTEAWDEVLSVEINDRSLVDLAFVPGTKVVLAGSGDGRVVPFDLAVAMTADEMSPQIGIDGDASLSWLQLARIAARQQHWDQVVDRLQQALRGGESVPHLELARAQWASGDRDAARTSLERARDAGEALDATLSAWLAAP